MSSHVPFWFFVCACVFGGGGGCCCRGDMLWSKIINSESMAKQNATFS